MALMSLKSFLKESSIKEEVQKWSIDDCVDYIEKHEKDSTKSKLLETKLDIVRSQFTELAENLDANRRKQTFKAWNYEKIVKHLRKLAPRNYKPLRREIRYPYKQDIFRNYDDIGTYLWARGYNITRFLGIDNLGCVWECDKKDAVRVILGRTDVKIENLSDQVKAELMKNDKNKKYFNYNEDLAEGNLRQINLKKMIDSVPWMRAPRPNKTIASTLRTLRQAIEAVIALHEQGYTHNDIEIKNFVKVDPKKLGLANKTSKDGKEHKHITQIGNFSAITKLSEIRPGDTKEEVEKRAVVALGLLGFDLLLGKTYHFGVGKERDFFYKHPTAKHIYDQYELGKYYGGTSAVNTIAFLDVLIRMASPQYAEIRPTLKEALRRLQQVKTGK